MDFMDFMEGELSGSPEPWPVVSSFDTTLRLPVDPDGEVWAGRLPDHLLPDETGFASMWDTHPEWKVEFGRVHDRVVYLPRWQQAFGVDYAFSDTVAKASPLPEVFAPYLAWAQSLDPRYNGTLVNWYDDAEGHYIGRHRDSTVGIDTSVPFITVSLGATRKFRLRPFRGQGFTDYDVAHGDVLFIPWATNDRYTHEVPASTRYPGRRISITFRAFTTFDLSGIVVENG